MANETEKNYSIKDAASAMGISEATVKAYKATLIKAFEHCQDKVLTGARSLNQYGLEQLKDVQRFHKIGAPDGYVALIQQQFPKPQSAPAISVASEPTPAVNASVEVISTDFIRPSKLATVDEREIQLPPGFDPSAMVKVFDGVVGQATDTSSLIAIAQMALKAVEDAMSEKVEAQRVQLSKSESDAKELENLISEKQTEMKIKALESRLLAERQTAVTTAAEKKFAELMNLGKPDASTSQP